MTPYPSIYRQGNMFTKRHIEHESGTGQILTDPLIEKELEEYYRSDMVIFRKTCLKLRHLVAETMEGDEDSSKSQDTLTFLIMASVCLSILWSKRLEEMSAVLATEDVHVTACISCQKVLLAGRS